MIERFNFYDVYGYLIPGAVLIALIWLPHAIAGGLTPSGDVSAALAALIGAYVAGHILQVVANKTIPINAAGDGRFPSDRMLDDADKTFASDFKKKVAVAILNRFGLNIRVPAERTAAFFLCRDALIVAKTTPYVEQFQGLYAMMRGVCAAAAIGCAYHTGWLWSPWIPEDCRDPVVAGVLLLLLLAILLAALGMDDRTAFGELVLCAILAAGILAADGSSRGSGAMSAAAILSLLVAIVTFGAYLSFASEWAKTVYRNFYLLSKAPPPKST